MAADGEDGSLRFTRPGRAVFLFVLHIFGLRPQCCPVNMPQGFPLNDRKRAMYSLKEAAERTGRGKPAILKAIQKGRISAKKNDIGEWRIDPAELHRVYPAVSGTVAGNGSGERWETAKETNALQREVEILREERRRDYELIEDLRKDRDHWRQQATALLVDQRATAPQKAADGLLARAWGFLRGSA